MINKKNEEKGITYWNWVLQNENEIKFAVLKNSTYDAEILEDSYWDTVSSVYERAMQDKPINDMKNYFFMSMLHRYRYLQNKKRDIMKKQRAFIDAFESLLLDCA